MALSVPESLWVELVASGVASERQCQEALARQHAEGGSLVEQLVASGCLAADLVLPIGAAFQIIPALGHLVRQPDLSLSEVLDPTLANRLLMIPYALGADRALHVACADPTLLSTAPDGLPPFNLRIASLLDVREGLDTILNNDPQSQTAPDLVGAGSVASSAFAHARTMLRGAPSDASLQMSDDTPTETGRRLEAAAGASDDGRPRPDAVASFSLMAETVGDEGLSSAEEDARARLFKRKPKG